MAVCTSKSFKHVALTSVTCAALTASLIPLAQVAVQSPTHVSAAQGCGNDSDGNPLPCPTTPVPEPSTLLLLAPAAGYLVAKVRGRRAKP